MKKFILNKIQKGFTPLELLLVVGISAVVAGLFVFTANAPQQQAALPPINVNVGAPNITVNPPDVNVNVETARMAQAPTGARSRGRLAGRTAGALAAQLQCTNPGALGASCAFPTDCDVYGTFSCTGGGVCDDFLGQCITGSNIGDPCSFQWECEPSDTCSGGTNSGNNCATDSDCPGAFLETGVCESVDVCGDGTVDPGEQCDDGNTFPGDGCDASCQLELFCGNGTVDPGEQCDEGLKCQFDSNDDVVVSCIPGTGGVYDNDCPTDYGDLIRCIPANSYCAELYFGIAVACETKADCEEVGGWQDRGDCVPQSLSASDHIHSLDNCDESCQVTINLCGNGDLDAGEVCDDGNTNGGDYCSFDCQVETGYCGDFIAQSNESCDDGNTTSGDGCSGTESANPDDHCQVEVGCPGIVSLDGLTCTLSPSNEPDGVKDVSNIQSALYWAIANPLEVRTVHLASGDFYVSRNIVVDGFTGTLEGAGMDNTTINVGRRDNDNDDDTPTIPGMGFSPAYHPLWDSLGFQPIIPTVLQLDNSTGLVTIAGLTIEVVGANPTDVIPDYYGDDSSVIQTIIDIQEGNNSTDFHNVRLLGAETNAYGNARGKNAGYGFHDMSVSLIKPDLTVKNIEVENMGYPAILAMGWDKVTIEGVMVKGVGSGILLRRASGVTIKDSILVEIRGVGIILEGISGAVMNNNTINMLESGFASMGIWESPDAKITNNTITGDSVYGINIWPAVSSRALIQGNTFKDGYATYGHVSLEESNNSTVIENTFEKVDSAFAAITILSYGNPTNGNENYIGNNNYINSGFLGWDKSKNQKPSIFLDAGTSGNIVNESLFKPGTTVCNQVLSADPNNPGNPVDPSDPFPPNTIVGYEDCTFSSDVYSHLKEMLEAIATRHSEHMDTLGDKLKNQLGKRPGRFAR